MIKVYYICKMEHKWEIGDEFKFLPVGKNKNSRCLYPNKTFIVSDVEAQIFDLLRYKDNRTNIKCKCYNCKRKTELRWNPETNSWFLSEYKIVSIQLIQLTRTKLERNRDIALNLLIP